MGSGRQRSTGSMHLGIRGAVDPEPCGRPDERTRQTVKIPLMGQTADDIKVLLQLLLVKYAAPNHLRMFLDVMLQDSNNVDELLPPN